MYISIYLFIYMQKRLTHTCTSKYMDSGCSANQNPDCEEVARAPGEPLEPIALPFVASLSALRPR